MADDDESLDDILSTPVTPVKEAPEEQAETDGRVRDEHGRFAPKGEPEEPIDEEGRPEPDEEPEGEHNAPVASVVAERRKRQAAESERNDLASKVAELSGQISVLMQQRNQPQQQTPQPEPVKPPEFWEAPDKYVEHVLSPFQQQIAQMTYRASRAEALAEFGKETVTTAQQALEEAVKGGQLDGTKVKEQLTKSNDPVGDIVRWHQNRPEVRETSMREQLRAELAAEWGIDLTQPKTPSPTPSQRNPQVRLPPSLSRIPAGHQAPERDESLDEVLSAPRRRA